MEKQIKRLTEEAEKWAEEHDEEVYRRLTEKDDKQIQERS